jgi:hypothetical protein
MGPGKKGDYRTDLRIVAEGHSREPEAGHRRDRLLVDRQSAVSTTSPSTGQLRTRTAHNYDHVSASSISPGILDAGRWCRTNRRSRGRRRWSLGVGGTPTRQVRRCEPADPASCLGVGPWGNDPTGRAIDDPAANRFDLSLRHRLGADEETPAPSRRPNAVGR